MSKKNRGEQQPQQQYINTGKTPEELLALLYMPSQEQPQQPQPGYPGQYAPQPQYPGQPGYPGQYAPQPQYPGQPGYLGQPGAPGYGQTQQPMYAHPGQQPHMAETTPRSQVRTGAGGVPEGLEKAPRRKLRMSKRAIGIAVGGVLVTGLAATTVVGISNGSVASIAKSLETAGSEMTSGGKDPERISNDDLELGTASFKAGVCDKPETVAMVLSFDAELPTVPIVTKLNEETKEDPADVITDRADSFLTKENVRGTDIPEDQITEDGYPFVDFQDAKLGVSICALDASKSFTKDPSTGKNIVDMSLVEVKFQDVNRLYNVPFISHTYNPDPQEPYEMDANKGEYAVFPDPTHYIPRDKDDPNHIKSLDDLKAAMSTEPQLATLFALGEKKVVESVTDVVNSEEENTTFEGGAKNMQEVVQRVIAKRLGVAWEDVDFNGTDFTYTPVVALNPSTRLPFTDIDPATGKTPLVNLDPNVDIRLKSVEVKYGRLSEPTLPDREPEPTTEPEPVNAP